MTAGAGHSDRPAPGGSLSAEDAKLVVLARGARGRAGTRQGAAVRDEDGRTYAGASVELPSLRLTALQAAVALAVASAAPGLEAAVVVGDWDGDGAELDDDSRAVAADLCTPLVLLVGTDGTVRGRIAAS